jgi:hypothetical protein
MAVKSLSHSSILQPFQTNSMLGDYESNYFHHLETVRLGGNAASVTFSNLSRYADYQHLQIRYTARSTRAGTDLEELILRLNNDSTANYSQHQIFGSAGVGVASVGAGSSTYAQIGITSGSVSSSHFAGGTIDLLDVFETTKNKTLRGFAGWHSTDASYRNGITLRSSAWYSTSAVNAITLLPITNSFVAGSRFSLYGIKARS